jgi:DNA polymerase elongation subunit (family B)
MRILTFDIETYINYTLFALRDIDTHELITFEIRGEDEVLPKEDIIELKSLLVNNKIITYNGKKFDEPITAYALKNKTAGEIFNAVSKIILDKQNVFQFYKNNKIKRFIPEHIDIMDVARGSASLKLYGARLDTLKLQDLPYEPNTKLKAKEMDIVYSYCENDNILTEELYRYLEPDLELREAMSEQYGEDLMSFKGAKIADIVLAKECGYDGKANTPPDTITYTPPEYIEFKDKRLKEMLNLIKNHEFKITDAGGVEFPKFLKDKFIFDGIEYQFGIGGLHGSVSSKSFYPKKKEILVDIDYKSLYPSIIIENNFPPKHLGDKFIEVYKNMYHQRNNVLKPAMKKCEYGSDEYNKLDRQQNSMKLVLNSSFGQTGQRFAKIYDPWTMISTTLTGQLTLMMVIEKLYLKGFSTYYANTDGITLLAKKKDVPKIQKITQDFDDITGLEMEYNFFKSSHIRDVNNFVNITDTGDVKAKGVYAGRDLEKNPQTPIVFEAVRLYLQKGKSIEKTIRKCKVVADFCSSRNVTGGAMYPKGEMPEFIPEGWEESLIRNKRVTQTMLKAKEKLKATWVQKNGKYLGKVVRFYYSTKGHTLHYKKSGNKVPMSDGAKPMMDLKKKLPKDLDYQWYIDYAYRMLRDLGVEV